MDIQTRIQFRNAGGSPLGSIRQTGYIRESKGIGHRTMRIYGMYALVYLLNGGGNYQDANGLSQRVGPGDLILVFPQLAHRYGPGENDRWTEFYISFEGPVFDVWQNVGILDPQNPIKHLQPIDHWLKRFESIIGGPTQNDSSPPLVEVCRIQSVLAEALMGGPAGPAPAESVRWVQRACALLETDLHKDIDLTWVAASLNTSYENFRKRFTRLVGIAPHRYRSQRRVDRATELIKTGRLSDKQIAATLGFCDEFHFSRKFKQIAGVSPRQYRQKP